MSRLLRTLLILTGIWLYRLRLHRLIMWWNRRNLKVVLYHACEDSESDFIRDLQSNTPPIEFARHLEFLCRHYRVVSLQSLDAPDLPDYAVLITFDDGYRSAYEHAFPLLRERGLPAVMYLVSDVVDNRSLVWVNALNWLLRRYPDPTAALTAEAFGGSPQAEPAEMVQLVRSRFDPVAIRSVLEHAADAAGIELASLAIASRLYVSWDEVLEMSHHRITFGSHTATHPNLARLPEADQRRELVEAGHALERHLGPVWSLAYPFGDHIETSRRLALELGYRNIMEVGGANRRLDPSRVARVPLTSADDARLFSELEVVAPFKAWLKRWLARR